MIFGSEKSNFGTEKEAVEEKPAEHKQALKDAELNKNSERTPNIDWLNEEIAKIEKQMEESKNKAAEIVSKLEKALDQKIDDCTDEEKIRKVISDRTTELFNERRDATQETKDRTRAKINQISELQGQLIQEQIIYDVDLAGKLLEFKKYKNLATMEFKKDPAHTVEVLMKELLQTKITHEEEERKQREKEKKMFRKQLER